MAVITITKENFAQEDVMYRSRQQIPGVDTPDFLVSAKNPHGYLLLSKKIPAFLLSRNYHSLPV